MSGGIVAENSNVCRSLGSSATIFRTSWMKSHIEHAVGLVEHEGCGPAEPDMALPDQVQESPGGRHQDVDSAGDRGDLRLLADATEDDAGAQPEMASVSAKAVADLQCQLACRGQHQAARRLAHQRRGCRRPLGREALQDRQGKGGGLAGAGLGDAQQVAAREKMRDRLRLDRGRRGIAFLGERPLQRFDQAEILKFHHVH